MRARNSLMGSMLTSAACLLMAGGPTAGTKPVDVKNLPANQWVERLTTGLKGQGVTNGGGLAQGLLAVPGVGIVACGGYGVPQVWRLDLATGEWTVFAPAEEGKAQNPGYNWSPLATFKAPDGREVPTNGDFHGMQVCYDPDRKVIVGFSRGVTIEFDLASKKWQAVRTDPTPPNVTAASLCYDPVNREAVLATGGFSPVGGTDGTWLYDSARKQWRRLDGPSTVEAVRLPLEKVRDRLTTLRWLLWKNLEFRATGREKLLDARSKAGVLAKEAAELEAELGRLTALAKQGAARADQDRMANAATLLAGATAKLAGLGGKVEAAAPEELETVYRQNVVPALEVVEKAVAALAITPEPRMSARLVYDSKNKAIVCFGGDRQDGLWGDTWVYHCEGRWWERRHPKSHPAPQAARAVAFDESAGLVVLLESVRRGVYHAGWRLWCYDVAADEWKALDAAPAKEVSAFWLEYDRDSRCLVALSQDLTKAWPMRLDPAAAKRVETEAAPEVVLGPTDGPFALRDAATVADLKTWQAEQQAWVKSVPANTWVLAPTRGTGRPNEGRTWSSIVYDPSRQELYYRDGGHGSYHGSVTDHYDLATGRWYRSNRRHHPPWPMGSYFAWGRSFDLEPWCKHTYRYGLVYNPLRQRLWRAASGQADTLTSIEPDKIGFMEYDPDTGTWGREPLYLPSLKDNQWMVPGAPDRLVNVSPFTRYNPKATTSVWQRTSEGEKTWPTTGALPYQFDWDGGMCWMYDAKRTRVLYYGGAKDKAGLFALDLTAGDPKWTKVEFTVAGGGVPPYPGRETVYVTPHDTFLMVESMALAYKDVPRVWALSAADHSFRLMSLAVAEGTKPPVFGGVSCGLQYDPVTDLCFYIWASNPLYAFRYVPETPPAEGRPGGTGRP